MHFIWNTKVHHHNHKLPMQVNILYNIKLGITTNYVFTFDFNIILPEKPETIK